MNDASNYYYNSLSKPEQRAYHAIMEGLTEIAPSFAVPKLDGKVLANIYFMVRMDHPEIFWSVRFKYRFYQQADNIEMIPEYIFPKAKIREHQQALSSRVAKLVRTAEKMTEKEKEIWIHDFICQNVHYDKLKKPYSHEIIGALGQGVGVCEGIAKAVKILCDRLGIWCIIALSEANPEKGIKYRHAWNIVRIGGEYCHLDATFDLSLSTPDCIRYDYVNLSDRNIFRDHEPVIWRVPAAANSGLSWYQEKKISFTKMEDVRKRAAQYAKKEKLFVFHWRGGYLTRAVLEELLQILKEEAESRGKEVFVSLNWPQAVLKARFSKADESAVNPEPAELPESVIMDEEEAAAKLDLEKSGAAVIFEEANEGERYEGE